MKEIKIYEIPSIDHMELVDDPYIGMIIYVANIDAYYSVKTLKEINGVSTKGNKIIEYVIDEYLDFGSGGGGGTGLTPTQLSNIAKIPAIQSTVDALPNNYASKNHNHSEYASKNHNHSEYASSSHRHDASEIDNLPSGGGTGLTTEQAQHLQTAYLHSQSTHVQAGDIPTKISDLTNDSGFLTSIPSEYITDSEMSSALSTKANTSDIPSLNGYATETFVTNKIAEAQLSGGEVDLSTYATKEELNNKADKTAIPTKISQLENDSDYLKSTDTIDADSLNGKKISEPMTKAEYDAIVDKDPNTIYLVDEDTAIEGIPSYSITEANKVLAVNSDGTALAWIDAPSGLVTRDVDPNEIFSVSNTGEVIPVYGDIVISAATLSINENATGTFTVSLSQAPTNDQTVSVSVSNSNCSVDKSSLTFTKDNYNVAQSITVTGAHNSTNYTDLTSVITLSSTDVSSQQVNVTIKNIDVAKELSSISAVYTQGDSVVYPSTSLDSLKGNLVVTATYTDGTSSTITDYTLSGTLTEGTSAVTVAYQGKTTTFNVTVTAGAAPEPTQNGYLKDGYIYTNTKALLKMGDGTARNGTDTEHYYFSLSSNYVYVGAATASSDNAATYYNGLEYAGECDLAQFNSGSVSCSDIAYAYTNMIIIRIPMSLYTEAGNNAILGLAKKVPMLSILTNPGLTWNTYTITDEMIDSFTSVTTWSIATAEGEYHTGFIPMNSSITGISQDISTGLSSLGGIIGGNKGQNVFEDWYVSVNGSRLNFKIPYGKIAANNINELKAYLKANRLIFYVYSN